MRKLVTVETITAIRPIADADAIEAVSVRGWTVVTKRGEFAVGDACVYFEIDAQLPLADERFAFLGARGEKTLGDGTKVHVLRTARLRGVYSQGLVLPLSAFPELAAADSSGHPDLAPMLRVEKWEPPLPAGGNEIVGEFPTGLARKTDAERVQNLVGVFESLRTNYDWVATEKLDGTSATFLKSDGVFRVCGRNWEISTEESLHARVAKTLGLSAMLQEGDVVQGEIYGEGVQGNPLKIRGAHFGVFAFLRDRQPVALHDWPEWARALAVPTLDLLLPATVDETVEQADGMKSTLNPERLAEGVVWHTSTNVPELDHLACFKAISNKYLLKQ